MINTGLEKDSRRPVRNSLTGVNVPLPRETCQLAHMISLKVFKFITLVFLAGLGLHCCSGFPLAAVSVGYSLAAVSVGYSLAVVSVGYSLAEVHGPLTVAASLIAEHGLLAQDQQL